MNPVYVVEEHGSPQASVLIGLYESRAHALDVAESHVHQRLQRCRQSDTRCLGISLAEPSYEIVHTEMGALVWIGLRHRVSGECDLTYWTVEPRTIISPPSLEQPELPSIFAAAGGAT